MAELMHNAVALVMNSIANGDGVVAASLIDEEIFCLVDVIVF
jgi:hypothetical protein